MQVTAIKSFDHNGRVRRGDVFECSDIQAKALKRAKLVEYEEAVTSPLESPLVSIASVLPAAPALPQTIAKKSDGGDTPKAKKATYKGAKRGRKVKIV